jgi:hypothetical protein
MLDGIMTDQPLTPPGTPCAGGLPADLTAGRTNHAYFYPRVRDGYRDNVVTTWKQNIEADATVRVLDSRGKTVREDSPGDVRRWTWNGRGSNGRAVAVGRYRIQVGVQDPDFDLTTSLDCWGGRYARATYTLRTPVSAKSVSYRVTGSRTGADICCDGRITKSGKRAKNKRSFAVTVRVNGWRAYEIRRAKVAYSVPVRQ